MTLHYHSNHTASWSEKVLVLQWPSGPVAQLPELQTLNQILCYHVKPRASLFTLHCSSSLGCINEYIESAFIYNRCFIS